MIPLVYSARRIYIITAVDENRERHFVKVTTNYEDAEDTLMGWGQPFDAEIATVELDSKSFKFRTVSQYSKGNYDL